MLKTNFNNFNSKQAEETRAIVVPSNLVSIIVPNHNRSDLLFETVESCLSQTYADIEVIIIDDGSDDSVRRRIRQQIPDFQRRLPSLQYHEIEKSGVCSARNVGFRASSGQYVQFLDSDDLLDRNKISRAMRLFKQFSDIDCVYGNRLNLEINEAGEFVTSAPIGNAPDLETRPYPSEAVLSSLWTALPISKRELVKATGLWNVQLFSNNDWEYGFRLVSSAKGIRHDRGGIAYCRQHDSSRISKKEIGHAPSILSLVRASIEGMRVLKGEDLSKNRLRAQLKLIKNIASAHKVAIQTKQMALFVKIFRLVIGK